MSLDHYLFCCVTTNDLEAVVVVVVVLCAQKEDRGCFVVLKTSVEVPLMDRHYFLLWRLERICSEAFRRDVGRSSGERKGGRDT